jgi:hypothetical protein
VPYKVTYFLQQQGDLLGGWQWSHYHNGANIAAVQIQADKIAGLLNQAIGAQAYVKSYRISLVGAFRQAQTFIYSLSGPAAFGVGTPTNESSGYISVDVQLLFSAPFGGGANYQTTSWLRGMRRADFGISGHYTGGPGTARMNAFLAGLGANGVGVWCLSKARATFPFRAANFSPLTGIITGVVGLGPASTSLKVRITGCGVRNPLNRLWICTYDGVNTLTLNGWSPSPPAIFIPITGQNPNLKLQTYAFTALDSQSAVPPGARLGITSVHKTGRPTGLLGGRAKPRRLLVAGTPAVV